MAKKKNIPTIRVVVLIIIAILLLFYVYYLIRGLKIDQSNVNRKTQADIERIEVEFTHLVDSMNMLTVLYKEQGEIQLAKERTLDSLLQQKNFLVAKLKKQLREQKVLEEDHQHLLTLEKDIKIEISNIIEKQSKAPSVEQLEKEIQAYSDSIKDANGNISNLNSDNFINSYIKPDITMEARPLNDCKSDTSDYFHPERTTCFKLILDVKKYSVNWNKATLKIEQYDGGFAPFKIMDSNYKIINNKTTRGEVMISQNGINIFYLKLLNKAHEGTYKFYLTQIANNRLETISIATVKLEKLKIIKGQ